MATAFDDDWDRRVRGHGCPLDAPRALSNDHWDLVAPLAVSSLYLSTNQTYRGQCQLIFDPRHVARIDQLTPDEWARLTGDLFRAHQAVMDITRPDHINVESLGNVVPHLHWHIIPRYRDDGRWGEPIWRTPLDTMPDTRLAPGDRAALIDALRGALASR
jgi:diadenosine tetraphosphate (Ap4A) HIT family hydrolase